mgnify:CR=1 FL=1
MPDARDRGPGGGDGVAGRSRNAPPRPRTEDRARDFWDAYWAEPTPTVSARTMTRVLDWTKLERLASLLPARGSTLEVGSGSGRLSCYLAQRGFRTTSLDFSLAALRLMTRPAP